MKINLSIFLALALINGVACSQDASPDDSIEDAMLSLVPAFPNLNFNRPVDLQHAGDESERLFVVEQRGVISVFQNDIETRDKNIFLDIEQRVKDSGNEEGLLGLAFHPDFISNRYFYVNYTASGPNRTIISRFEVSPTNPNQANPESELIILEIPQPYSNHNGGQISFGPDGFLYIAVGDGGSGGDPQGHGQNRHTLLGTILRIDVDQKQGNLNYAIPSDNPFAGNSQDFREEIYAYGLRNPWRFSFDPATNQLWTGDVGQNAYEEVDIIEKGGNYGWNIMEGTHCFRPSSSCPTEGLKLPVWEYGRSEGASITGGFVYRGAKFPQLLGRYIYGDFASGRIWGLDISNVENPKNTELARASSIASFGVDQSQELYICSFDGKIYKFANK